MGSADQQVRVVLGVVVKTGRALALTAALRAAVATDHTAEQDQRKDADADPDLMNHVKPQFRTQQSDRKPPISTQ